MAEGKNNRKPSDFSKRKDIVKNNDEIFRDGRETDVIIPVMGKTGVGKSTFINTLLDKNVMKVGHDIVSCTSKLQWEIVDRGLASQMYPKLGDRRLIIVDTPGFDDTFNDDSEILRRISAWLGSSYAKGTKLGGIIYLQNIAERRMEGASRRNLEMFKKLCGTDALHRVILGTTSWQEVTKDTGDAREKELRSKFWKEMIDRGSIVDRFDGTHSTAIIIVRHIFERPDGLRLPKDPAVLQLQEELVDMKKYIPQTSAGRELLYSIEQILEAHKDIRIDDEEEKQELRRKVQALEAQMKKLRLPFWIRLKTLFGL